MTLATRCSSCGTTFRIDQQALSAAEGWVRCGRCREVFNAIEGLFEARSPGDPVDAGDVASTHGDDSTHPADTASGRIGSDPARHADSSTSDAGVDDAPTLPATIDGDPAMVDAAHASPENENTGSEDSTAEPAQGQAEARLDGFTVDDTAVASPVADGADEAVDTEVSPAPAPSVGEPMASNGDPVPARVDVEDDARDLEAARISLFGPDSTPRGHSSWFVDTQVGADGLERMSLWPAGTSGRPRRGVRRARPRVAAHRRDDDFELSATTVDVVDATLPSAQAVDQLLASNERDTNFADYEPTSGFEIPSRPTHRRRPSLRMALRVAAIMLGVGLVLQLVLHSRESIAARWPVTEGPLQRLCAPFGCEVDAPREIEALQVQSATLQEASRAGLYELSVVLVNRSELRVRMPALDLRISDARGDTVARRVLTPSEIGQASTMIAPGGETTMRSLLRIDHAGIAGYEVSVFYP